MFCFRNMRQKGMTAMPVYGHDNGSWYVKVFYKNWKDEKKWTTKRGFRTKREAQEWEREFLLVKSGDVSMRFSDFAGIYLDDIRPRIKESTLRTKQHIVESKLIPYFGDMPLCEISSKIIFQWQNELIRYKDAEGKGYASSYLKTVHNQLSAMLNHAVRFYGLQRNEARVVGNMGSEKDIQIDFWTKEEYLQFAEGVMDDPKAYYCFEMLYWCGIREGENLALTKRDFDFTNQEVSITKTYHRLYGKDIVTDPKTPKSRRKVKMPDFLCQEMQDFFRMTPELGPEDRIFAPITKGFLYKKMNSVCGQLGLKRIRIHDLRHSHVSLLINMGFTAMEIAERVGHESINVTYRYAHLFPNTQKKIATQLNLERREA